MKEKTNGVSKLKDEVEEARQQVIEQELSARSWRAMYEKMYYSLEVEKLEPEYNGWQTRMQQKMDDKRSQLLSQIEEKVKEANPEPSASAEEEQTKID